MHRFSLVEFSVKHPKLIVFLSILITLIFMSQFPKARTDTNPKHMLPETADVRVWNDEVDKTFALYEDMIVVGIVNERGVLNKDTLGKIKSITNEILKIKGVAAIDVNSFPTITNVTADTIREIVKKEGGPEKYYIAGDPVARDTFGAEMFKLMAIFAPIAAMIMLAVRYLMFRDLFLSVTLMMDAMICIIWSMGILIALGFPIHIMSSMSPVFLMAIATDSIHIFNEFYFRYREKGDKTAAIIETMNAVVRPVRDK